MLSAGGLGSEPYSLPCSEHHDIAVRIQPHYSLTARAFVQLGRVAKLALVVLHDCAAGPRRHDRENTEERADRKNASERANRAD